MADTDPPNDLAALRADRARAVEAAARDLVSALEVLHYAAVDLADLDAPGSHPLVLDAARRYFRALEGLRTRGGAGWRWCLRREADGAIFPAASDACEAPSEEK